MNGVMMVFNGKKFWCLCVGILILGFGQAYGDSYLYSSDMPRQQYESVVDLGLIEKYSISEEELELLKEVDRFLPMFWMGITQDSAKLLSDPAIPGLLSLNQEELSTHPSEHQEAVRLLWSKHRMYGLWRVLKSSDYVEYQKFVLDLPGKQKIFQSALRIQGYYRPIEISAFIFWLGINEDADSSKVDAFRESIRGYLFEGKGDHRKSFDFSYLYYGLYLFDEERDASFIRQNEKFLDASIKELFLDSDLSAEMVLGHSREMLYSPPYARHVVEHVMERHRASDVSVNGNGEPVIVIRHFVLYIYSSLMFALVIIAWYFAYKSKRGKEE